MKEAALLALSEGMQIDQIQVTETGLVVLVISTTPSSCCPLCSQPSSDIHSHYHRTLKDAPCVGRQLQLSLTVRKFFCRNPLCARKVGTRAPCGLGRAVGTDDDQAKTSRSASKSGGHQSLRV
jgi:transposase